MMRGEKFHGKPCIQCGSTLRYVKSHKCVRCELDRVKAYQAADPNWSQRQRAARRRYLSDPAKRARYFAATLARTRALERLALAHPEELDRYIDVERALLGLPVRQAS